LTRGALFGIGVAGVFAGAVATDISPNNVLIITQVARLSTINHYMGGLFFR
jgi:hypothetical protein